MREPGDSKMSCTAYDVEQGKEMEPMESPQFVRISLAAAMTLGFQPGLFYRNARLHCVNLLLTYSKGCAARCAYCGLSQIRPGNFSEKSFIRVTWPVHRVEDIIQRIAERRDGVKRICVSMLTGNRAVEDTRKISERLRSCFDVPVSLLVSPTVMSEGDLISFKSPAPIRSGLPSTSPRPNFSTDTEGKVQGGRTGGRPTGNVCQTPSKYSEMVMPGLI